MRQKKYYVGITKTPTGYRFMIPGHEIKYFDKLHDAIRYAWPFVYEVDLGFSKDTRTLEQLLQEYPDIDCSGTYKCNYEYKIGDTTGVRCDFETVHEKCLVAHIRGHPKTAPAGDPSPVRAPFALINRLKVREKFQ
jgi:hypothetical protein